MKPLAILDIETDPFEYGRVPKPFAVGVYTAESWRYFWGADCIAESVAYISSWSQEWIFAWHNGGKFDGMYYLDYINGNLKIINGRIVECKIGQHTFRDSYAILPFPLRNYKKDEIDYAKMEAPVREQHKAEILDYLHGDCQYLYELVHRFYSVFGQRFITVGSASMSCIRERHDVPRTRLAFDRTFRKDFFFGGRVQCFATGIVEGDISIYDVNSMYPAMMRNRLHPADEVFRVGEQITDDTCFVVCEGRNLGGFPKRTADGLNFIEPEGQFTVTRYEYDCALATQSFIPGAIIRTFDFPRQTTFSDFVDFAFDSRAKAKSLGDDAGDISWKYVANSGYGKFAQNPANFADWKIAKLTDRPSEVCPHCKGGGICWFPNLDQPCYQCEALNDFIELTEPTCMFCGGDGMRWHLHEYNHNDPSGPMLWSARTFAQSYNNVATGATITGSARATLLHGLSLADNPLYCDTDSIITTGSFRGPVSKNLGEWKLEGTGILAAIAGKKMYCIFSDREPEFSSDDAAKIARRKYPWMFESVRYNRRKLWPIKKAHKGMKLSPAEILEIAQGGEIEQANPAPAFSVFREPKWIKRRARMTV